MLYRDIIAVCSQIQIKHVHTLRPENIEFFNVTEYSTWSNHWAVDVQGTTNTLLSAGMMWCSLELQTVLEELYMQSIFIYRTLHRILDYIGVTLWFIQCHLYYKT